jgi:hypothetical protein
MKKLVCFFSYRRLPVLNFPQPDDLIHTHNLTQNSDYKYASPGIASARWVCGELIKKTETASLRSQRHIDIGNFFLGIVGEMAAI